jgi:hypothetical protein
MPVRVDRVGDEYGNKRQDSKVKQFGLRALKWPLTSRDVEKLMLPLKGTKPRLALL